MANILFQITPLKHIKSKAVARLFVIADDFKVPGPQNTTTTHSKVREIHKKFNGHVLITG